MRLMLFGLLTSLLLGALSASSRNAEASDRPSDIVIRNGGVIDGSGRPGLLADVAIKGDRIVRIGDLRGAKAKREIDARGQVVAPGFIDMLGQSETFVLIDPRAMSKVMMGVTTEITGEGESIAPINDRIFKEKEDFYLFFILMVDLHILVVYFMQIGKHGTVVNYW